MISIDNKIKGYGFLVSLPININNRYLYGLLTLNQTLSKKDLTTNKKINLYFKEIKLSYDYIISENTFVFTCNFINISFVEIPLNTINKVKYLRVLEEPYKDQKICICQIDKKGTLNFCGGSFKELYGTYIISDINGSYENIADGLPIISLSEGFLGDLVAINEKFLCDQQKQKVNNYITLNLNINIIIRAIRSLVQQNKITKEETLSEAKTLSQIEMHVLKKAGLIETENPCVFISPESLGVTPLWFYRTHYAWFWTPTSPQTFSSYQNYYLNNFYTTKVLNDFNLINWSIIQPNFPIRAIGGMWNNAMPAERNVELIKFLINSGLRFLMPQI